MIDRLAFALGLLGTLVVLVVVMGASFFADRLGHDYSYFLPLLLAGFYWSLASGLLAAPWFTPAMCGGLPFLANPQNMYYSVPQALTLFVDPVSAALTTIVIFGALGFLGMHRLLVRRLDVPADVAVFVAAAFVLNGFWLQRMLTGHFTNHGFMLVPLIALCLLPSARMGRASAILRWCAATGLIAYLVHSGAANLLIAMLLAVTGCGLVVAMRIPVLWGFLARLTAAGTLAAVLSASKISAALALVGQFPRDQYGLPGFPGIAPAAQNVLLALLGSDAAARTAALVNGSFPLPALELDYGLTPLAWALALLGLLFRLWRRAGISSSAAAVPSVPDRWLSAVAILLVLLVPVALNTFVPAWTELLRSLPYLRSSSNLLRWIALDIPVLLVVMALAMAWIRPAGVRRASMLLATLALFAWVVTTPRYEVFEPTYDPGALQAGWAVADETRTAPAVERIVTADAGAQSGSRAGTYVGTSDVMVAGASELLCYEPLFGYRLERFPIGSLHPGSVFDARAGRLNVKNPSCYGFGEANGCAPGDHFDLADRASAEAFLAYRPFPFERPVSQRIADGINLLGLVVWLLLIVGALVNLLLEPLRALHVIVD